MVKSEITLFVKNQSNEIGKLAKLFAAGNVNIEAISIHDASGAIEKLVSPKGKSPTDIPDSADYEVMKVNSKEFVLVHIIVSDIKRAKKILTGFHYIFEVTPVMAVTMKNRPGEIAKISSRFAHEGININYVYGSIAPKKDMCSFIFGS